MMAAFYRQMLVDLDRALRPNELEAMKYLCADDIPLRRREEINRALALWEVLEERQLLSPLDTHFLKDLIRKAAAGRDDLVTIITVYEQQLPASQSSSAPYAGISKDFDIIVEGINIRKWRTLARRLGLSDQVIDNLAEKYNGNTQEQVRQALILWSKGDNVSRESLVKALKSCEMNMTAHKIETLVQSNKASS